MTKKSVEESLISLASIRLLLKISGIAITKIFAALTSFAITLIVTRELSNEEAGLFLLGFTMIAVLSSIFRLGLDNVVLRLLSAHGADDYGQEKLNRALLWVATVTIPIALLIVGLSGPISMHIFNKPKLATVLSTVIPALPAFSLFFILSFAFQAQHRFLLATICQNLGVSILFLMCLVFFKYAGGYEIGLLLVTKLYSYSALIILIFAFILWFTQKNNSFKLVSYRDKEMVSAASNLFVATIMSLSVQWSGVLIVGVILSAEDVALLSAAQRTALLVSFILLVVNLVISPIYARLWKEGDINKIRFLAKWSTRGMIIVALPIITLMIIFREKLMVLFGADYASAGFLLAIMVLGQFFNVATGSVGVLLNMSGHERDFNRTTLVSGSVTICLTFVLVHYFGIVGAAIAFTCGITLQNILAALFVKKRLGFVPFG